MKENLSINNGLFEEIKSILLSLYTFLKSSQCFLIVSILLVILLIIQFNANKESIKESIYDEDNKNIKPTIIFASIAIITSYIANTLYGNNIFITIYNVVGQFFNFNKEIISDEPIIQILNYVSNIFALLTTAQIFITGFLALKNRRQDIKKINKQNESTVIYTDSENGEIIYKALLNSKGHDESNTFICKDHFNEYFKATENILVFNDDEKTISFYNENVDKLENHKTKWILNSFEPALFGGGNYKVYNINEMIAKDFWLLNNPFLPWDRENKKHKIAFIGLNNIGMAMLKNALLNNIFAVDQEIEYNVWGSKEAFEIVDISDMNKTCGDSIVYRGTGIVKNDQIEILNECDVIIISEITNYAIQKLLTSIYGNKKIYIYNKNDLLKNKATYRNKTSDGPTISFFGDVYRAFNETNFYDEQEEDAKLINKYYESIKQVNNYLNSLSEEEVNFYKQKENTEEWAKYYDECIEKAESITSTLDENTLWKNTDLYSQRSSIASANYDLIRKQLFETDSDLKEEFIKLGKKSKLCEMEHIRWCRFCLLDGFRFAPDIKNYNKKLHMDLVKYDDLLENEKKDFKILFYLIFKKRIKINNNTYLF